MRTFLVGLVVFCLGLGAAFMVATPNGVAGAAIDGTITGGVADGAANPSLLTLSVTSVDPGTYEFDISDSSTMHNFDICKGSSRCTNSTSLDKTGIATTTSSVAWDITLTPGTYTYQCDAHGSMTKHFTVTGAGTTTTGTTQTTQTTTAALAVRITSTHVSRSLVRVSARANELSRVTAVLLHKGKRLARAAKDGTSVSFRLRPAHPLAPGRYLVKVTVKCCGSSATAKKTIRVR